MEGIGIEHFDQSNPLSQVLMAVVVVMTVVIQLKTTFFPTSGGPKSKVEIMKERLKIELRNGTIVREENTNLSEWQLLARRLIRNLKNDLVDAGGEFSARNRAIEKRLEAIENREVDYGGDKSA